MRTRTRLGAVTFCVVMVAAACTPSGTSSTSDSQPATTTSAGETVSESPPETTSTTMNPVTTTQPTTDTTDPPLQIFTYAVVAEERARRLSVIDPASPCSGDGEDCNLAAVLVVELTERPHNMTSVGSVVYTTHPAAGAISRVDLATGDILTVQAGVEPHDIKYDPTSALLHVADESGRQLLTIDPATLSVLKSVDLPARAHDLAIADDAIWVTLVGRAELARVRDATVDLFPTGGSPHDLIVDEAGLVWFSNWNSRVLSVLDPEDGSVVDAPAGVTEPHHFAISSDGQLWVSDNGGGAVVGFTADDPVTVAVGAVPHHIVFVDDVLVIAVSAEGEAAFVRDGRVFARSQLSVGLHGVAVVELTRQLVAG